MFDSKDYYISVNRRGYYLYDTRTVALFDFDGRVIYTYNFGQKYAQFGQKNYADCLYIYDDKVFYSETRQNAISSKIYCVNMLTKKETLVWGTQKGDSAFDDCFRASYQEERGTELPFSGAPSNLDGVSCQFLYANNHRVIAGYTRHDKHISYIIQVDLAENKWSILDCSVSVWSENSKHEKRIFSFNMTDDTMWVKTNDTDILLVQAATQKVAQLHGKYSTGWKLCELPPNSRYYYFTGKLACIPAMCRLYRLQQNGGKKDIAQHNDQSGEFWCFDDIYYIPGAFVEYCFRSIAEDTKAAESAGSPKDIDSDYSGGFLYHIHRWDIEDQIKSAKQPQPATAAGDKKSTPSASPNPTQSWEADMDEARRLFYSDSGTETTLDAAMSDESAMEEARRMFWGDADEDAKEITAQLRTTENQESILLAKAKTLVASLISKDTSGYQYTQDQIRELESLAIKELRKYMLDDAGSESGSAVSGDDRPKSVSGAADGRHLSLAAFRRNAPSMAGFREALLSYRKSLPDSWDYNAFVGILLGVRGPKHGDAACMNFAIGQGDNGNNTRKTMEAKGLMPVFEKYKGRNIDESILLSDVEDEIISAVPEYAPIRRKLHEILER